MTSYVGQDGGVRAWRAGLVVRWVSRCWLHRDMHKSMEGRTPFCRGTGPGGERCWALRAEEWREGNCRAAWTGAVQPTGYLKRVPEMGRRYLGAADGVGATSCVCALQSHRLAHSWRGPLPAASPPLAIPAPERLFPAPRKHNAPGRSSFPGLPPERSFRRSLRPAVCDRDGAGLAFTGVRAVAGRATRPPGGWARPGRTETTAA